MSKARVCTVVATPLTIQTFLQKQLQVMGVRYDLSVVCNSSDPELLRNLAIEGTLRPVGIERRIRPHADLAALIRIVRLFRRERFDLVHSVTPKAGLMAMLGSFLAGCPRRVHTFTGQVWVTRSGVMRQLLRLADKIIALFATHVLADGVSQRGLLISEGVVPAAKISVLAKGSIAGVDATRFAPNPAARREVRIELGISDSAVVFLFLGRLKRDKGRVDLARAFREVSESDNDVQLVLVGPDEDDILAEIRKLCGPGSTRLHVIDYSPTPERFIAAADVLSLPSYREGFNNTIIEAAACGIPVVASRIPGIADGVEEGVTGLLHPPGDVAAIASHMRALVEDRSLGERLGRAARKHALTHFAVDRVTDAMLEFYDECLLN